MSADSGEYKVICFDAQGRQDRRFEEMKKSLSRAIIHGELLIEKGYIKSFSVYRRLYHSISLTPEQMKEIQGI